MTVLVAALVLWLVFGLWLTTNLLDYVASGAVTISLASLATSSTWLAGRESTLIDNTTNKYLDYHLSGVVTVGTTPTVSTEIRVYVVSMISDSVWPDVFDGTDSAETVTSAGVGSGFLKLAAVMSVDATTSDRAYPFGKVSVASLFGGVCPPKFVIFIAHNTGVNLNSTAGNHVVTAAGINTTNSG
jgi:hypothetical protein